MNDKDVHKEVTDKYSLRGRVFKKIREDILSGVYSQNEELKETTIGAELGVSRTPVREALRQLELEGLVNIIPNKGAYVNGISEKDIHDIYIIRSYLEGLCARWACEHITQEQIDELEEVVYLSEFHAKKEHHEQIVELDNKFHQLIYEASSSKILNHVLSDFHHYVQRIRKITLASDLRAANSNKEHTAILDAIRQRDGERAENLAHEHIMNTIKNISERGL
ncbi:GntR family transcriptional regulator [Anaerocolumna cellulosilytica]|uniref:GntR family transcriptional regulator n=1 Tax=Anaerocolumna cellulosilytica TaxID=433286 RepID=A0A6S6R2I6_9FIRM|nr:GntR family transcriptional regulator [Anaerocolumna cellulosilytica]MBB5197902.1 DNA-binding GntR family transcriptional regulator [Anaerocolumna cellulosilytica]BCJ95549.1 GntR family transcriptional regulator [Anaerocolumna cellulosilytica]